MPVLKEVPVNCKREKKQISISDMFKKAPKRKAENQVVDEKEEDEVSSKAPKLEVKNGDEAGASVRPSPKPESPKKPTKCPTCGQKEDETIIMYEGHPEGHKDEMFALFDQRLQLEGGDSGERPSFQLTSYTVYCDKGHVVRFDNDLIEKGKTLYFSGYLKAIWHTGNPSTDPDIAVPIGQFLLGGWWNAGFDGGLPNTGFTGECGDYYLQQPSDIYAPLMRECNEKVFITKQVIEFLEKNYESHLTIGMGAEYEDLLNSISEAVPPEGLDPVGDETIQKHAEFIVNQVFSYEDAGSEEDVKLLDLPAMKFVLKLAGIKKKGLKRVKQKLVAQKPMPTWTSATVTDLVRGVFDAVFADQMAEEEEGKAKSKARTKRCNMCDACLRQDCGECRNCKDMTKFGGSGKSKQACIERKCTNAIKKDDDEEPSDDEEEEPAVDLISPGKDGKLKHEAKKHRKDIEWLGEGIKVKEITYYREAVLDENFTVKLGGTVLIQPAEPSHPLYVAIVKKMFETRKGEKNVHVQWFGRGTDTVLGEAADPTQLFLLNQCEDQSIFSIWKPCTVDILEEPNQEEWKKRQDKFFERTDDGFSFWCQQGYIPEDARFEYFPKQQECPAGMIPEAFCAVCLITEEETNRWKPIPVTEENDEISVLNWDRAPMKVGDSVFIRADADGAKLKFEKKKKDPEDEYVQEDYDEEEYPEKYRKSKYVKGNNDKTPAPFKIGTIKKMFKQMGEVKISVNMYYRPEDTHKGEKFARFKDENELFWSEQVCTVDFSAVRGRCWVKFADQNETNERLTVWSKEGKNRFYFREWYDLESKEFEEPPPAAKRIGQKGKGNGKGKGSKGKNSVPKDDTPSVVTLDFPTVQKKLRTLDIFSGCGGLSEGLHQAGVAESHWAVEIFQPAANAYKLNNPDATVFQDDCNLLLDNAMKGVLTNKTGQKIPQQGEVDLLCGGPPCQGFSGMNRFNHREYSQFKNSLVSTYLSYCDFYRPRFFILENVRNFASFKKNMVLRLCIRALVKMGYQCSFGILQAGQFGVAQTRRRAILLAAAPGEVLPLYPEPTHVFSPTACSLNVQVDGIRYTTNARWVLEGAYRTVNVRDTMSDLPKIANGANELTIPYGDKELSHFQRKIRAGSTGLKDHITKKMAPLIEARMELIPTLPGSDWRDLPNKAMKLKDGSMCKDLQYLYHDAKQGKSKSGAKRGVCPCMESKDEKRKCDPQAKQQNTLIPWCLPHTSNRHNQWAGLYGRVEWDGFFSTTITNPEPMGKQGRVLHPSQHRLVSVRECARSQGFPDSYKFYGSVLDKHKQVGNAVPPPMAKALGLEIREAMGKRGQN